MQTHIATVKKITFHLSRAILLIMTVGALLLFVLHEMELVGWTTVFSGLTAPILPYANRIFVYLGVMALVALCGLIPTAQQVHNLEIHHRAFKINMDDVTQAYAAMHAADRQGGVFLLSNQFDAVRERLEWARVHPELGNLENGILTVAAQMSEQSHNLAEIYSDANVRRARLFLTQRFEDVALLEGRIEHAQALEAAVRSAVNDIDLREASAASQLSLHLEVVDGLLGELGFSMEKNPDTVTPLRPVKPAE